MQADGCFFADAMLFYTCPKGRKVGKNMKVKLYECPLCGRKFVVSEARIGKEKYQCPRCFMALRFDGERFREEEK